MSRWKSRALYHCGLHRRSPTSESRRRTARCDHQRRRSPRWKVGLRRLHRWIRTTRAVLRRSSRLAARLERGPNLRVHRARSSDRGCPRWAREAARAALAVNRSRRPEARDRDQARGRRATEPGREERGRPDTGLRRTPGSCRVRRYPADAHARSNSSSVMAHESQSSNSSSRIWPSPPYSSSSRPEP